MAERSETRRIVLDERGQAKFERIRRIQGMNGYGPLERVMESRTVSAAQVVALDEDAPCLPVGCRFYRRRGDVQVFVTEDAPRVRSLQWDPISFRDYVDDWGKLSDSQELTDSERLRNQTVFSLAFPYVVKAYRFVRDEFCGVSIFYRNNSLTDFDDVLSVANLPNQNESDESVESNALTVICMPRDVGKQLRAPKSASLSTKIARIDEIMWGSQWNADIVWDFEYYSEREARLQSPWHWERASQKNPLFMTKIRWMRFGTVRATLRVLLGEQSGVNPARLRGRKLFDHLVGRIDRREDNDE
ncbi:MAG: hypothetical protein ABIG71_04950 [Candidatus Uhrbacteria bacterium]